MMSSVGPGADAREYHDGGRDAAALELFGRLDDGRADAPMLNSTTSRALSDLLDPSELEATVETREPARDRSCRAGGTPGPANRRNARTAVSALLASAGATTAMSCRSRMTPTSSMP